MKIITLIGLVSCLAGGRSEYQTTVKEQVLLESESTDRSTYVSFEVDQKLFAEQTIDFPAERLEVWRAGGRGPIWRPVSLLNTRELPRETSRPSGKVGEKGKAPVWRSAWEAIHSAHPEKWKTLSPAIAPVQRLNRVDRNSKFHEYEWGFQDPESSSTGNAGAGASSKIGDWIVRLRVQSGRIQKVELRNWPVGRDTDLGSKLLEEVSVQSWGGDIYSQPTLQIYRTEKGQLFGVFGGAWHGFVPIGSAGFLRSQMSP